MAAMPRARASAGAENEHGRAVDRQRPGVGGLGAGDDADERRLARAVLADEGVHLAGGQLERQSRQRPDAGKGLLELRRDEQRHSGQIKR